MPASDEYTSTTNYSLKKPIDGQAQDAWGLMINEDLDTLDTTLDTMQTDIDSKAPASNPTFTGTITAPNDSISGDAINGGTISNFRSTGIDDSASTTTALTIDASGNVGVGETSPSTFGKVVSSGGTFSLVTDTSSQRRLSFWSTANGNSENAYIQVQNDGITTNTGEMLFATKNSGGTLAERMRIDTSGNVGINKTDPSNFNELSFTQKIVDVDGIIQSRQGIIQLGGTTYRKAGFSTSTGTDDPYLSITVATSGSSSSVIERMRIDSSGHVIAPNGVTLGTAVGTYNAANTLDDYEEGTWTLTASGSTGSAGSYSQTVYGNPYYTKIGNMVTVAGSFSITNTGSYSGELRISGLPFQVDTGNPNFGCYGSVRVQSTNYDSGGNLLAEAGNGLYYFRVQVSVTGTGNNPMQFSEVTTSSYIAFTMTYRTNQ